MDNDSDKYLAHAHNVTPALSRAFGASIQQFNQAADELISHTRQNVDSVIDITQVVMIVTAILGIFMLIFTDRYMAEMMQKPLGLLRQHFTQIAKGDLSHPVQPFGNSCVGKLFPILEGMRKDLSESVNTIRQGSENIYLGQVRFQTVIAIFISNRRAGRRFRRDGCEYGGNYRCSSTEYGKHTPS